MKVFESSLERLVVFQILNRDWRNILTMGERDLLLYLIDGSVSWGRNTVGLTLKQMAEGTRWIGPCGQSLRSINRNITSLRERGIIRATYDGRKTVYALDADWRPEEMIRKPKRLQASDRETSGDADRDEIERLLEAENANPSAKLASTEVPNWHRDQCQIGIPIKNREKDSDKRIAPAARVSRAEDAIKIGTAKAKERKAKIGKPTPLMAWRSAWTETFPDGIAPAWGPREKGTIKNISARLASANIDTTEFIDWAVRQWSFTMAHQFAWMDSAPSRPNLGFVIRFIDQLIEGYAIFLSDRRLENNFSADADYEKLRATGMDHDAVLVELGRRKGIAEQRLALHAREQEAARTVRAAQIAKAQATRGPIVSRHKPLPPPKPIDHGDNPFDNTEGWENPFEGLTWEDDA